MAGKEKLISFKKMWVWLCAYPEYDRKYYMKNSCPLSSTSQEDCDGCQMIWKSDKGTLYTDHTAPLYQWLNTEKAQRENRAVYASSVAVLAMDVLRNEMDHRDMQGVVRRSSVR